MVSWEPKRRDQIDRHVQIRIDNNVFAIVQYLVFKCYQTFYKILLLLMFYKNKRTKDL